MRPVNLIPPEERRGGAAPLRTGPLPYVVLGGLVLLLAGVVALVLANNHIGEREVEVATLEREDAQAAAKAQSLAAYSEFRAMSEERVATVSELADSRFDWERVMRELSLVLPGNVWLVGLTATVAPEVNVEGGSTGDTSSMRAASPGPALELSGCADSQNAVAGFVTALEDIDGVTRVGVQSSALPEKSETDSGGGGDSEGDECRTREYIAKFGIVVVFDAAPVVLPATAEGAAPVPAPEDSEEEEGDAQTASDEGGEG
ncbi:MAG TPA: PilN domain-containing protein [Solirubrobacterales bacterium]|nr:PilN domain-containing protein [Solirubrobacterales bacterium]